MVTSLRLSALKLAFFMGLSTVLALVDPFRASSHELVPTISDLSVDAQGDVIWSLQINLEAFLAGIDLDAVGNTDDDVAAEAYDALRALSDADLKPRVSEVISSFNTGNVLQEVHPDGRATRLKIDLFAVTIPNDVAFELPRISVLELRATPKAEAPSIIVNWPTGSGALVVRQQGVEEPYTGYLEGGQASPAISFSSMTVSGTSQIVADYIPFGFAQVLPAGLMHILFALGVYFFTVQWASLLMQVAAFATASFASLVVATVFAFTPPSDVIVLLAALSVLYIAMDNLVLRGPGRWRYAIVFGFGLVHGIGFATGFANVGIPSTGLVPALAGFQIGTVIGILTVMSAIGLILGASTVLTSSYDAAEDEHAVSTYAAVFRTVAVPGSVLIALVSVYWCIEHFLL